MNALDLLHAQFCDDCLVFKGLTPRTIKWFKEVFRYYQKYHHHCDIQQITRESLETWLRDGKLNRNWNNKTIRNRMTAIKSFLTWCVQREYLLENPIDKIPKPKLPKKIPKHLSKEQSFKLLEWTKHYRYHSKFEKVRAIAIIATFLFTGVRRSELENLKLGHVNLEERILLVESGKGDKDRIIPMNTTLISLLKDYIRERENQKKQTIYFFTCTNKDDKMGDKVLPRLIEKLRNKSGIYFYAHMLRHSFATLMLEGNCDLFSLSKMMGHSDIKTTTIYLSATHKLLQQQIIKHPLNQIPTPSTYY